MWSQQTYGLHGILHSCLCVLGCKPRLLTSLHKRCACHVQGADAPLSGLIAMLAAAEMLGNSSYADLYRKRLVFAAFAGEPWGYMGSKRFLWELHSRENSTRGLSLEQIEQVRSCNSSNWWSLSTLFDMHPLLHRYES